MDNPFVICPYNPSHRVLKLRLQKHIVRCRKHYVSLGMKPCPYNATHIIHPEVYRQHIETCPDMQLLNVDKFLDAQAIHGKFNQGAFHFDIDQDEDWESSFDADRSSQITDSDCSQIPDQFLDSDEDEEPLFRYFFDKRTVERLPEQTVKTSADGSGEDKLTNNAGTYSNGNTTNEEPNKTNKCEEVLQERISPYGAGRGRLYKMLASLNL